MLAMARADILEEQLERLLEDDDPTGANVAAVSQGRADLGSVRALLAPLDHLGDLSDLSGVAHPAGEDEAVVPSALPQPLLDLLPADQRERLTAAGLAAPGMAAPGLAG